uniref:Uncharacterized protein n=1 Tax=Siphoviridae sp. ctYh54 TaxID=2826379 RepID=A0A8S5MDX9_9CAUD|nr:MAG TPA: hypothetical protein [Siphoviridae sp. ctYh54]
MLRGTTTVVTTVTTTLMYEIFINHYDLDQSTLLTKIIANTGE